MTTSLQRQLLSKNFHSNLAAFSEERLSTRGGTRLALAGGHKEDRTMAAKILVPLTKGDRIEEIIPYLEKVAQTDTRVVFLIHHQESGFKWLQAYCGVMECGLDKALMLRKMIESYSVKTRRQLAAQKVFQTCQSLHQLGVKTAVELYSGSTQRILNGYARNGNADLVIMRPRAEFQITRAIKKAFARWTGFQRPSIPPVLLLHPGA
jgi:hypothetical protein